MSGNNAREFEMTAGSRPAGSRKERNSLASASCGQREKEREREIERDRKRAMVTTYSLVEFDE